MDSFDRNRIYNVVETFLKDEFRHQAKFHRNYFECADEEALKSGFFSFILGFCGDLSIRDSFDIFIKVYSANCDFFNIENFVKLGGLL